MLISYLRLTGSGFDWVRARLYHRSFASHIAGGHYALPTRSRSFLALAATLSCLLQFLATSADAQAYDITYLDGHDKPANRDEATQYRIVACALVRGL